MRPSVMIVEDDADCREVLEQILEEEGYRVESASNGAEALVSLHQGRRPSLILLDLRMPVMDGFAFRAAQRREPSLAQIPVVIVTALGDPEIRNERVLEKPIDLEGLLATVRQACSLPSEPALQ